MSGQRTLLPYDLRNMPYYGQHRFTNFFFGPLRGGLEGRPIGGTMQNWNEIEPAIQVIHTTAAVLSVYVTLCGIRLNWMPPFRSFTPPPPS